MRDINGGEFREGGLAMLLCQVVEIGDGHIRVRIMNSHEELAVGASYDEVLGGLVADSELTAFEPLGGDRPPDPADDQADGVKTCSME
jgi:hypothetical protein